MCLQRDQQMDARAAAFIHYYAREGYLQHVQSVCNELIKHGSSPVLQFWRAYGLLASGATAEAIRQLYNIQQHADVALAATAALLTAHQAAKVVDDNAVMQLSAYLEVEEGTASGAAALHLAAYLFYCHSLERARSLLEKQVEPDHSDPEVLRAQALLGFVLLEQQAQEEPELQDASELRKALQLFDNVLQHDPQDLEAVLGKACALEATGDMRAAWELLSEASIRLPWAVPVHMELARLTLAQQDWDGLLEVTARLQQVDGSNIMALCYLALHALLAAGDGAGAAQCLADLAMEVQRVEPSNAQLMVQLAACFARLAGSDAALLRITCSMAEKALQLQPDNPHYVVEAAAQQLLMEQPAAATAGFEAALRLDELHIQAVLGLVEAHLAAGQLEEAEQQLQFLPELLAATRAAGSSSRGLGEVHGLFSGSQLATKAPFGFMHAGGRLGLMAQGHSHSRAVSEAGDGLGMQVVAGGSAVDSVHQEEPLLMCLRGLLAWKQGKPQEGLHLLQQGIEQQLEAVEDLPYGLAMFGALNASRMLGLVRLFLDSFGGDPRQPSDPPSLLLSNCIRVLELLSRFVGSHPEAQLLYARTLYLNGSMDAAARKAANILGSNHSSTQAALLVVSIHLRQGRPADAMAALEAAVSANFSIREAPVYHVLHAQVLMANGQLEEARKVLETAMSLPGVRSAASPEQAARLAKRGCLPSAHERARIFLLLAEVITRIGKPQAAADVRKLLQEAVQEFEGTSEEVSIMVAHCEASIAGGYVAGALQRLKSVPATSPHYVRACVAMAEIYLKHRKDSAAYIKCYLHLVEKSPDYDSYCMLAEAYMALQEPDKAAAAYESALAIRPKDSNLAVLAANAYVAAHDYNRAIDHFNRAVRNDPSKLVLQHSLARLLLKLGQVRPATGLLDKCLEAHRAREEGGGGTNLEALALDVDTWLLLAKLRQQSGDADGYVAAQNQALKLQTMLLEHVRQSDKLGAAAAAAVFDRDSNSGTSLRGKGGPLLAMDGSTGAGGGGQPAAAAMTASASGKAASICFDLAEFYRQRHQFDKSEAAYTACLTHKYKHGAARLALARLALANGQVDACQQHASLLLEDQPDNEDAAIMLAEIMAHQGHHDSAVSYFQKLLDRKPSHYTVLVQLLGMLRRAGKLKEADKYLAAAEAASGGGAPAGQSPGAPGTGAPAGGSNAAVDGGLAYCRGLLQKYLNNPHEALQHLNAAWRHVRWSTPALLTMAGIYLNPESDVNWATDSEADVTPQADGDARESVRAAGTLLKQLKASDMQSSKYKILSAYIQMANKSRSDIEAAVGQLLDLANNDPNNVPVLMALAHGFLLLKQTAKARNQLKRVSKLPYVPEDADEFERAWLALADIHVAGGKFDLAQELCARCLKYNRSCSRAWELLGSIAEREQAYKDAASHYEHAWQLSNEKDAAVGYKLAFNYLKAGRNVAAITVAQAVLKADPQYPRIKQDVLEKARVGLKP